MTRYLYILFLLFSIAPASIATNGTTTDTVGWVGDPNGRGTLSLVISSLLTLGLCVWSAMHLNIPPRGETEAQIWIKNLKWGLVGVVAPELVVFAAWRQYNSAKALHDILETISKENQGYNSKVNSQHFHCNDCFFLYSSSYRTNIDTNPKPTSSQDTDGQWYIASTPEWEDSSSNRMVPRAKEE